MQPTIPFDKLLEIQREKNQPERLALYAPRPGDPLRDPDPRKPERPIRGEQAERGAVTIDFVV